MSVADNLMAVRTRIDDACRACHRDPDEVSLLPVSKTKPPSMVEAVSYTHLTLPTT